MIWNYYSKMCHEPFSMSCYANELSWAKWPRWQMFIPLILQVDWSNKRSWKTHVPLNKKIIVHFQPDIGDVFLRSEMPGIPDYYSCSCSSSFHYDTGQLQICLCRHHGGIGFFLLQRISISLMFIYLQYLSAFIFSLLFNISSCSVPSILAFFSLLVSCSLKRRFLSWKLWNFLT